MVKLEDTAVLYRIVANFILIAFLTWAAGFGLSGSIPEMSTSGLHPGLSAYWRHPELPFAYVLNSFRGYA